MTRTATSLIALAAVAAVGTMFSADTATAGGGTATEIADTATPVTGTPRISGTILDYNNLVNIYVDGNLVTTVTGRGDGTAAGTEIKVKAKGDTFQFADARAKSKDPRRGWRLITVANLSTVGAAEPATV